MSNDPKFAAELIGGALGVISAILTVFGPVIRDRTVHSRRLAAYDAATKELTYCEYWLRVSLAANPSGESQMRNEAAATIRQVQADLSVALSKLAPVAQKDRPSLFNRVLLLYRPLHSRAWPARVLFYLITVFTLLGLLAGFTKEFRSDLDFWLGMVLFLLVCLATRALARVLE